MVVVAAVVDVHALPLDVWCWVILPFLDLRSCLALRMTCLKFSRMVPWVRTTKCNHTKSWTTGKTSSCVALTKSCAFAQHTCWANHTISLGRSDLEFFRLQQGGRNNPLPFRRIVYADFDCVRRFPSRRYVTTIAPIDPDSNVITPCNLRNTDRSAIVLLDNDFVWSGRVLSCRKLSAYCIHIPTDRRCWPSLPNLTGLTFAWAPASHNELVGEWLGCVACHTTTLDSITVRHLNSLSVTHTTVCVNAFRNDDATSCLWTLKRIQDLPRSHVWTYLRKLLLRFTPSRRMHVPDSATQLEELHVYNADLECFAPHLEYMALFSCRLRRLASWPTKRLELTETTVEPLGDAVSNTIPFQTTICVGFYVDVLLHMHLSPRRVPGPFVDCLEFSSDLETKLSDAQMAWIRERRMFARIQFERCCFVSTAAIAQLAPFARVLVFSESHFTTSSPTRLSPPPVVLPLVVLCKWSEESDKLSAELQFLRHYASCIVLSWAGPEKEWRYTGQTTCDKDDENDGGDESTWPPIYVVGGRGLRLHDCPKHWIVGRLPPHAPVFLPRTFFGSIVSVK